MRGRHVAELLQDLQRAARGRVATLRTPARSAAAAAGGARPPAARRPVTRARLAAANSRLDAAIVRRRHAARTRLGSLAAGLGSLSPLAVLGRGYAVCWDAERRVILRDALSVADGDAIRVTLARGELQARVTGRDLEIDR